MGFRPWKQSNSSSDFRIQWIRFYRSGVLCLYQQYYLLGETSEAGKFVNLSEHFVLPAPLRRRSEESFLLLPCQIFGITFIQSHDVHLIPKVATFDTDFVHNRFMYGLQHLVFIFVSDIYDSSHNHKVLQTAE